MIKIQSDKHEEEERKANKKEEDQAKAERYWLDGLDSRGFLNRLHWADSLPMSVLIRSEEKMAYEAEMKRHTELLMRQEAQERKAVEEALHKVVPHWLRVIENAELNRALPFFRLN